MKVQDFGHLDGPVVLFGGPYSNLQALKALVEALDGRHAICTGDLVGYCAEPNETIDLYRHHGIRGIAGNCDRQLAEGEDDCGCGFGSGSECDLLSRGWWPYLLTSVPRDKASSLQSLPDIGTFLHQGRRYGVIHGGVHANNRFLWPSTEDAAFREEIDALEALVGQVDGVIAGHSGIPFHRKIGKHQWINAGAIGLPPHDARPDTRYGVLSDGDVVFERLGYDHETARRNMEAAGLTQGYHETLSTGVWPSEDVLPEAMRR